ncbi:hypothetical protein GUI12_01945 [Anaplasmataceae bacterium AB001_6]|nr:hypothetical protein GUI12_01945 [Anaplasmataceae bacterium AB001_6]
MIKIDEAIDLLKMSRANFVARDIMTHLTHCKFELDNLGSEKRVVNVPSFFQDSTGSDKKIIKNVDSIIFDIADRSLSGEMFHAQGNMTRQVNLIDEINKRVTLKSIVDIAKDENLKNDFKSCVAEFKDKITKRIKDGFVGDIRTKYQDQLTKIANIEEFVDEVTEEFDVEVFLKNKETDAQSYVPNFDLLDYQHLDGAGFSRFGGVMHMIYTQIFKDENSVQDYYRWGRHTGEKFADSANLFSTEQTEPRMSGIVLHHTVVRNSDTVELPFYSDESAELHKMGADSHVAIPQYKVNMDLASFLPYSLVQNFDLGDFNAAWKKVDSHAQSFNPLIDVICANDINIFKIDSDCKHDVNSLQECVTQLGGLSKQFQKSIDLFTDQVTRHVSNKEVYKKGGEIVHTVVRELDQTKLFDGLDDASLFRDFADLSFMICKLQSFGADTIKSWIAGNPEALKQFKDFAENFSLLNSHKIAANSHFFVCEGQGNTFCIVPQSSLAYHAGISSFSHDKLLNEKTVGVEIESLGSDNIPARIPQRSSVAELSKVLMDDGCISEYDVHKGWVLTHQQIATRKGDPNLKTYLFNYKEQQESVGTGNQQTVLKSAKTMMNLLDIKSDKFISLDPVTKNISLVGGEEISQVREIFSQEFKFDSQKCDGVIKIGNPEDLVEIPYKVAYVFLSTYDSSVTYGDFVQAVEKGDNKGFIKAIGNVVVTFNKNISMVCDIDIHDTVKVVGGEKIAEIGDSSYHVHNGTVLLAAANLKNIVAKDAYNMNCNRSNHVDIPESNDDLRILCDDHNEAISWSLEDIKSDNGKIVGPEYLSEYFLSI